MKSLALKPVLALLFAGMFTMSATTGIDSFEIYLNNRLLLRHSMNEPLTLKSLKLTEANINDNISIHYMQCTAPSQTGKNRKIALRDEEGNLVKEWKFKDGDETNNKAMVIPVKELLALQKNNARKLILSYTAEGYGRAQQLAAI